MSDFFGKLKSGAGKMAFEAEKLAKVTRAKNELENLKNQLKDQYAKLGQAFYAQRTSVGGDAAAFDEMFPAIDEMHKKVDAKAEEVKQMEATEFVPEGAPAKPQPVATPVPPAPVQEAAPIVTPAAPAATKFCPNCGKEVSVGTKFCPDCGTAL